MSGVDTAWLRMEDPTNLMMITGLIVLDGPVELGRLRAVVRERLLCFDRFRQHVVQPPGLLARPRWVESGAAFDLERHVRRLRLPAPAGRAELEEAVSRLMSTPLDYARPLWSFHLVERYAEGAALVMRLHHCLADGMALLHVLRSLTDAAPGEGAASEGGEHVCAASNGQPASPSAFLETRDRPQRHGAAWARRAGRAAVLAGRVLGATGKLIARPPDPPTPLRGALGVPKRAVWSGALDLDAVKAVGRALEATVNDVLLAALAGALHRYLVRCGEPPARGLNVRAAVPVNLRPRGAPPAMGNRFGLVFLSLPVGLADPEARLHELKRRMNAMKQSLEAVAVLGLLGLIGSVPPAVQRGIVGFLAKKVTAVATNVIGPRRPRYLAGARLRRIVPWVPQAGRVGLGLSIISYDGEVTIGVATDTGIVPEPERLVAGFYEAFAALQEHAAAVR